MSRQPLTVTSPTHGMALGAYFGLSALGFLNVLDVTNTTAINELLGPLGTALWASSMAAGGALAFVAALASGRYSDRLADVLRIEGAAATAACVTTLLYLASLIWMYGWLANPITKIFAATWMLGSLVRIVQIIIEVRKLERAKANPETADPAPLADPDSGTTTRS